MKHLISAANNALSKNQNLPFSIYSSLKEQRLLNVPIVKPLLIVILDGQKKLGKHDDIICSEGEFIFISDSPETKMQNIPSRNEYRSLLIEFEYEDFKSFDVVLSAQQKYVTGKVNNELKKCLLQFIDWSTYSPTHMWSRRREEIIELLYHIGYKTVLSMISKPTVSQQLHHIINKNITTDIHIAELCSQVAMSESTLRRKLNNEGTNLQEIKDQVRLGTGLHLLQTTHLPINIIAEKCGYLSQSRFSDRFKLRFGLTPSSLRKTRFD